MCVQRRGSKRWWGEGREGGRGEVNIQIRVNNYVVFATLLCSGSRGVGEKSIDSQHSNIWNRYRYNCTQTAVSIMPMH